MNGAPQLGRQFTPAAAPSASIAPSVEGRADQVRQKAEAHHERHAKAWVASRYTRLLVREGNQPALRPAGATDDRKAHLMRAAIHSVERKQHLRIARIERAAQRISGNRQDFGR